MGNGMQSISEWESNTSFIFMYIIWYSEGYFPEYYVWFCVVWLFIYTCHALLKMFTLWLCLFLSSEEQIFFWAIILPCMLFICCNEQETGLVVLPFTSSLPHGARASNWVITCYFPKHTLAVHWKWEWSQFESSDSDMDVDILTQCLKHWRNAQPSAFYICTIIIPFFFQWVWFALLLKEDV